MRPTTLLFAAATLFGVLQSAPLVSQFNGLAHAYLFPPFALIWLFLVLANNGLARSERAYGLAAAMSACGLVSVVTGIAPTFAGRGPTYMWFSALFAPVCLFVGLQLIDAKELGAARKATRLVLFLSAGLQSLYYVRAAGLQAFSPDFVFSHHTDISWWTQIGGPVLGNPNNASSMFCAGFGWAVGERAMGARGRLSGMFLVVTAMAVWVTASRGAILTALFIVVLAVGLRRSTRWLLWASGAGVAVLLALSVDWSSSISFATTGADQSLTDRWGARLAAIPVVLGHPFGSGVGSTATSLKGRLFAVFTNGDYQGATSHDLFLNWGVATGWVGLTLIAVTVALALRRCVPTSGWLSTLPLLAFLIAGESAGIDVLNATNPAWSVMLWALLGLAWRGRVIPRRLDTAH